MEQSSFVPDFVVLLQEIGYRALGTDIFFGSKALIPVLNDGVVAVSVIPTPGRGDDGTHNLSRDTIAYEQPSCQLTFRSNRWLDAWNAASVAQVALKFEDRFVNGTWWRICAPKGEPFDLPPDDKNRARVVFNLETTKRLSPATS